MSISKLQCFKMELNCRNSCSNGIDDHYSSDISIANVVHMLQKLLNSPSFSAKKIMSTVTLLKQIKNNVSHCHELKNDTLIQTIDESSPTPAEIDESSPTPAKIDGSSPTPAEIDGIIKQAESLLDIFAEENLEAKFNGETVNWFLFWESFEREIQNREDLPLGLKFACLKERLEGWPLNMILKLGSEDSAYNDALKLLQTTFSNKKVLVESHLNALLDLEPPTATPISLMRFSSDFEYHIRALKSYGTSIEEAGFFVVAVLNKKLPKEIWNRINKAESTSYWTLPEFQNAFKSEIQLLNFEFAQQANNDSAVEPQNITTIAVGDNSACKSEAEVAKGQDSSKHSLICQLCLGCHMPTDCTRYKTSADKVERAIQLGFCLLCINSDHSTDKCLMASCKFCSGRLNSLCVSAVPKACNKKAKNKKKNKKRKKKLKKIKYCPLCSEFHEITGCKVYKTSLQRMERAKVLELCLLCIKDEHATEQCLKKTGCKFCNEKHNTLLCVSANSKVCNNEAKNKKKWINFCQLCSGPHDISGCTAYETPMEKMERTKQLKLCLLCIEDEHITEQCVKKAGCKFCKGKHNTLLCALNSKVCDKSNMKCPFCSEPHGRNGCIAYKSPVEKMERAKELNLCIVCLKDDHTHEKCSWARTNRCKLCRGKHNKLLCPLGKTKLNVNLRNFQCVLCSGSNHQFGGCPAFKTNLKRHERALTLNLCQLCLKDSHKTIECSSSKRCKSCKGKHNTQFCLYPYSLRKLKKEKITEKQTQEVAGGFNDPIQGIKSCAGNYHVICALCSSNHHFGMCPNYKTFVERRGQATQLCLCLICLDNTHTTNGCLKLKGCKFCGGRHNTALCIESDKALRASDKEAKKERRRKRKEEKRRQKNALIDSDNALRVSDKEAKKERLRKRKEKRQQRNALINNPLISDFIMSSRI